MRSLLFIFFGFLLACTNEALRLPYGQVAEQRGYVPARIAVLKCQPWPAGARFSGLELSDVADDELLSACRRIDTSVLDGFKDQPFMRGFSPSFIEKMLSEANQKSSLTEWQSFWTHGPDSCLECETIAAFYSVTISKRVGWRQWLAGLSRSARNADAVLLPFLVALRESEFIDRGVKTKQRAASVALLLVDSNNGSLLWSGARRAFASSQAVPSDSPNTNVEYPNWDIVYDRLLVEDLWRDFPGRQVFR